MVSESKFTIVVVTTTAFLLFPTSQIKAQMLDIQVPSNGTPVISSVLEAGKEYEIWVEETYSYCYTPNGFADAEWSYDTANNIWIEHIVGFTKDNQDLFINNTEYDWLGRENVGEDFTLHTFSPDHIYKLPWMGQGEPLEFHIYDEYYGDNSGTLTVNIIPEPATLLLLTLGGLLLRRRK